MTNPPSIVPLPTSPGFSWNTHCLLTRYALRSCHAPGLDDQAPVIRLENFLEAANERFGDIVAWYRGLLSERTRVPIPAPEPPPVMASPADFLRELRLNPAIDIPYVRALTRDEAPVDVAHDLSRQGPPRGSYKHTDDHEMLTGREILAVFSDEPDWGMDQDLFPIEAYGYGPPPFGPETGKSSQAPFHMAFFHEYPVVRMLFPQVRKSFLDLRVRVFFALAGLAEENGIPYWSFRFRAWAMHYLQDLTQPYHAKSLPFPVRVLLRRLARNRGLKSFAARNKNLLMNRHHLFEAIVHLLLNEAARNDANHPFFQALQGDGHAPPGPSSRVVEGSSKVAADLATKINRSLELLVNDPLLDDPNHLVADDPGYPLEKTVARASSEFPELFDRFLKNVSTCLEQTGKVTRYAATMTLKRS